MLAYTVNLLDTPLKMQPLRDISRAVRLIRAEAGKYSVDPDRVAVCGFSAGGHLAASLCVHFGTCLIRTGILTASGTGRTRPSWLIR